MRRQHLEQEEQEREQMQVLLQAAPDREGIATLTGIATILVDAPVAVWFHQALGHLFLGLATALESQTSAGTENQTA